VTVLRRSLKRRTRRALPKPSSRMRWQTARTSLFYQPAVTPACYYQDRRLRLASPPQPPVPSTSAAVPSAALGVNPPPMHTRAQSAARRSSGSSATARPDAGRRDLDDGMLDDLDLQQVALLVCVLCCDSVDLYCCLCSCCVATPWNCLAARLIIRE
jgi:hypothetical protein